MLTVLAPVLMASVRVDTIKNGETRTPAETYGMVRDVAKLVGMPLYAPDSVAQGYALRKIEMATLPVNGKFGSLSERKAVRMVFFNKSTTHSFDVVQTRTGAEIDSGIHMKWVMTGGFFEMGMMKDDTFVSRKVGAMDIGFHSSLVGSDSAKEVLKRMVKISP